VNNSRGLAYRLRIAPSDDDSIKVSTPEFRGCRLEVVRRPLPRRGGIGLLYRCPACATPRRYLYGLIRRGDVLLEDGLWRCSVCAGLRFASQGRYRTRLARAIFTAVYGTTRVREPLPRHPWDPRAVSDPRIVISEFPGVLIDGSETLDGRVPDIRDKDAQVSITDNLLSLRGERRSAGS
jgi:hypothetical protein